MGRSFGGRYLSVLAMVVPLLGHAAPPIVIDFGPSETAKKLFTAYRNGVDYSKLLGTEATFRFLMDGVSEDVSQEVSSIDLLAKKNPHLAKQVRRTLNAQKEKVEKLRAVLGCGEMVEVMSKVSVGLDVAEQEDLIQALAGETFSLSFDAGTELFLSNDIDSEMQLFLDTGRICCRIDFLKAADRFPKGRDLELLKEGTRVDTYIVHTHPGAGAPLSHSDVKVASKGLFDLEKAYPDLNFTVTIIAASVLDDGNVIFLHKVSQSS